MEKYCIVLYTSTGEFIGVIAGMGKNKGTWEDRHSRSAAYRIRKQLMQEYKDAVFKVELAY